MKAAVIILAAMLAGCSCEDKVVRDVGGCDAKGLCRVGYTDGGDGYQYYPVAGQSVKECQP